MIKNETIVRWFGVGITLIIVIGGIIATWAAGNQAAATAQQTAETNEGRINIIEKEQAGFKGNVEISIQYIQKDISEIKKSIQNQITIADITEAIKAAK